MRSVYGLIGRFGMTLTAGLLFSSLALAGVEERAKEPTAFFLSRTEEGADVRLKAGESGEFTVSVLDEKGKRVATLHEGLLEEGDYEFQWKPGRDAATGEYQVVVSPGASPSLTQSISYQKPKYPSRIKLWKEAGP